jgi:SAM-dependent methyltransferase
MSEQASFVARDDWDRHWQAYTAVAERNPSQRYRRQLVLSHLAKSGCGPGARILDIGSGQGDLAVDLHNRFPETEIAGVELSTTGVEVSKAKVPSAHFVQRNLLEPVGDIGPLREWAQFAVCSEVLEHVDDPATLLRNASEYLAPGSTLIVTVPGGPKSQYDLHIGHRQHFTPASIRALLETAGFQVDLATGAGFPFFNLYRLVVVLRGKSLIHDVDSATNGWSSILARGVMSVFHPLFALNLMNSRLGWQIVAVARVKE